MRIGALAGLSGAVALAALPAQARADRPWPELAREIAAPWPAAQHPDGSFPDAITAIAPGRRDEYGSAMLGYALLEQGLRDGNGRTVEAGLAAIHQALRNPMTSPLVIFENLALASAYNAARRRLSGNQAFESIRGDWEQRLRSIRLVRFASTRAYYNQHLVEAVGLLELLRTGLQSQEEGTALGDPAGTERVVSTLLDETVPATVSRYLRFDRRAGEGTLVSDPPGNPLAYHGLSIGLLARALELRGGAASAASRTVLDQAARSSWALMAPDGDLSYIGRSQEQAWVLTMTAYGMSVAARLEGVPPEQSDRYRAVAQRAIARLERLHMDAGSLAITPAVATSLPRAIPGLDFYAAQVPYTGLTLVGLNWAIDGGAAGLEGRIGSDDPGGFTLGAGTSTFGTVRTPNIWFAVKRGYATGWSRPDFAHDLRYDFGLAAAKIRRPDGSWTDLLPIRPRTGGRPDTTGPLLRVRKREKDETAQAATGAGFPDGNGFRVWSSGKVTMALDFRTLAGKVLRRGARLRYEPTSCGVRMVLATRPKDNLEYSVFFADHGRRPKVASRTVSDSRQQVTFSQPARVTLERGYASGTEPALTRARLRFANVKARQLSVTICGRRVGGAG